jgi:upstream activation factor subunit UAF30
VTQKIWAYIRENNLQNPKNRREIFCDQKLEELFGRKKVDMFRMTKLLSAVFIISISFLTSLSQNMKSVSELQSGPLPTADEDDDEEDEEEEEVKPTKRRRITKVEKQGSAREHLRREATQQKEKETKKKKAVTKKAKAAAKVATDGDEPPKEKRKSALTKPVELSEKLREFLGYRVVPRTTVTKLVWKYIKEKDLQDPENRKNILCDAEMERVFEKKQFTMFEMNKYLSQVSNPSLSSLSPLLSLFLLSTGQMMSPTSLPSEYPSEE